MENQENTDQPDPSEDQNADNNDQNDHNEQNAHVDDHEEHHVHHHKESFISKYVFSMDHKMISKQFLITAIIMAIIAMFMSLLFRMQLAWDGEGFAFLELFLGKWAEGGVLSPDMYLALITMHGTILVFSVLTGGLSGTFANLLIPLHETWHPAF